MSVRITTYIRFTILFVCFIGFTHSVKSQCSSFINSFPYNEGFETSSGGWFTGGVGSDWTWGTPSKPVITGAGGGSRCWIVGGLTGSSYTNSEASWLQSPCFDFTSLQYPYITFKVFWEMEQRFDGANIQYSVDNGAAWSDLGSFNETSTCLNVHWYNYAPVTYLASLSSARNGWSGNIQSTSGSCQGGNGSNGWVTAKHIVPALAGQSSVIFRFTFGAGTICNNYDGFAIDDITIGEAPPNNAGFTYNCKNNNTVDFTNTSALCPTSFNWDFGDPASGTANTSDLQDPSHTFSSPGPYIVSLTVSGPGNAPSTITKAVTVLGLTTSVIASADCINNNGGSATVNVTGGSGNYTYSWNTNPVQTNAIANDLPQGIYTVTVSSINACTVSADVVIPVDPSCVGIYFPSAFTPNGDGRNDSFGPLGSLSSLSDYHISIYNRWGQRVFDSTDPFQKWDGRVKGKLNDNNLFVWYAEYVLAGQGKLLRKGSIVLIK
jgi:gliding motility-associated-like protein